MKKYELTTVTNQNGFAILFQIKAQRDFGSVKAGDLGGWIEKESNLSQDGNCWVSGNARVSGNAWISGNAEISKSIQI